jgi:hypothetical protein
MDGKIERKRPKKARTLEKHKGAAPEIQNHFTASILFFYTDSIELILLAIW